MMKALEKAKLTWNYMKIMEITKPSQRVPLGFNEKLSAKGDDKSLQVRSMTR